MKINTPSGSGNSSRLNKCITDSQTLYSSGVSFVGVTLGECLVKAQSHTRGLFVCLYVNFLQEILKPPENGILQQQKTEPYLVQSYMLAA